ncbi:molybdenum cofactor cytidylyltransferase [Caldalkalibacillus uzonensis]|uniref:Molybdenum cofactor cytidylyltransferase n=1 Tax=Caldalkalibacillus uzonensis TaxID=353224 RepID=A0ABU0CXZ2_9BACI|nr:nucleotidyltransferase family protein [Caldalkalibacillus uzonensis]MDQ0341007.1 molybdenum cofactor cytidylyltransferase [Caldalkalibacillus uzonensis]
MMTKSVWILVLAAGFSKRMGEQKLLLPIGKESLLRYVVQKAVKAQSSGVVVVLNPNFPQLFDELKNLPVYIVWNPKAHLGLGSSIQYGIQSLPASAEAVTVLLADQPHINLDVIKRVMKTYWDTQAPIVQANYLGQPGHPVLFDKSLFSELMSLKGDRGGKDIINKYKQYQKWVYIPYIPPTDIDTYEDYQHIILEKGDEV